MSSSVGRASLGTTSPESLTQAEPAHGEFGGGADGRRRVNVGRAGRGSDDDRHLITGDGKRGRTAHLYAHVIGRCSANRSASSIELKPQQPSLPVGRPL